MTARQIHAELLLELWQDRFAANDLALYQVSVYADSDGRVADLAGDVAHVVTYAEETRNGYCRFLFDTMPPVVCSPTTILTVEV